MHVARRALGADAISVRDEVLSLDAEVDVDRFELAAAEARRTRTPGAYRLALAGYNGDLLPENRYDDWAIDRRDRLAGLVSELTKELAALGPPGAARELPADASSFVGRGRELGELGELLHHTRLLTLSGPGGVGKTRLALQLARASEASYAGGVGLVELATSTDPHLVADAVAAALDVRGLPGQDVVFVERARAAAPGFVLDEENVTDVARICFRLDGLPLPLALELAAGRTGALSPAAIAERLGDRFGLLRSGNRAAPTRQQTLAATLHWSHDLLEPDEQALFRRLVVFAGGFDLNAAEIVCGGNGLGLASSADVLARLVEKSLVVADEGGSERRYTLLETVRLYARERLDEAAETRFRATPNRPGRSSSRRGSATPRQTTSRVSASSRNGSGPSLSRR